MDNTNKFDLKEYLLQVISCFQALNVKKKAIIQLINKLEWIKGPKVKPQIEVVNFGPKSPLHNGQGDGARRSRHLLRGITYGWGDLKSGI